jgi:hypothetical protein
VVVNSAHTCRRPLLCQLTKQCNQQSARFSLHLCLRQGMADTCGSMRAASLYTLLQHAGRVPCCTCQGNMQGVCHAAHARVTCRACAMLHMPG